MSSLEYLQYDQRQDAKYWNIITLYGYANVNQFVDPDLNLEVMIMWSYAASSSAPDGC